MNKGIRIINYLIDLIIISIISSILSLLIFQQYPVERSLSILVFIAYYLILEYFTGQTVGKVITRTKVADINNAKPGFIKILIRTLLRLVAFDLFSYMFGVNLGIHDILSRTKLINKEE